MGTEAPVLDDNRLIRRGYKVADMNVDIITLNIHTGHHPIFFLKMGTRIAMQSSGLQYQVYYQLTTNYGPANIVSVVIEMRRCSFVLNFLNNDTLILVRYNGDAMTSNEQNASFDLNLMYQLVFVKGQFQPILCSANS